MRTFPAFCLQLCLLFSCGIKQEKVDLIDTTTTTADAIAQTQTEDVNDPVHKLRYGGFLSFKEGDTLVAVNPAGVPMMDSPNSNSNKIKTLAYGEAVNILQNLSDGKDDLVVNEVILDTIRGKWIKVEEGNKTGFVFSAFLGRLVPPSRPESNYQLLPVNNTFTLTYDDQPQYSCTNNFEYRSDLRYYGLYNTEEGVLMKPIDLFFYVVRDRDKFEETYFEQYVIKANTFFSPSLIIGCKADMKERYLSPATPDSVQFVNSNVSLAPVGSVSVEVVTEAHHTFYVKKSGQVVFSKPYAGSQLSPGISVLADLNLDGINDYIVNAVDYAQWSFNGLILGAKNNTIKLVAQYEDYECH